MVIAFIWFFTAKCDNVWCLIVPLLSMKVLPLPKNCHLLFQVHRTRKIATLFEDELSSLKERFSNILVKSKTLNGYDPTKSRVYRHTAKPVPSRDKEKITCEQKTVINAEEEKEFSSGSRNLVNNAEEETKLCNYSRETMNSASRKGSNNIINDCDPVPVIG